MSEAVDERIVNDQAYLLLYRRRDTPFRLPPPLAVAEDPASPSLDLDSPVEAVGGISTIPVRCDLNRWTGTNRLLGNTTSISVLSDDSTRPFPAAGIVTSPQHVTTINTSFDGNLSDEGNNSTALYKATSMIDTRDAVCGNFVSDIFIGDGAVGGAIPGPNDAALPGTGSVTADIPSSSFECHSPVFGSVLPGPAVASHYGNGSSYAGGGCYVSGGIDIGDSYVTGDICDSVNNVFGPSDAATGSSDAVVLDEVTPMSMSSASQPSLSSTEEESLSTAQDDLD